MERAREPHQPFPCAYGAVPADVLATGSYTLDVIGEPLRDAPRDRPLSYRYTLEITRAR